MISSSELDEHIHYLQHRVEVLTALHEQFLTLGVGPDAPISRAIEVLERTDPSASADLREALESLAYIEERLSCSSHYFFAFRHGGVQIEDVRELTLPILKMRSMRERSYCAVAGRHMLDEPSELADARARAVQSHMRSLLPSDAIVKVESHRCDRRCRNISKNSILAQIAEVFIAAKWKHVAVSAITLAAQSTSRAAEAYIAEKQKRSPGDA